MAGHALFQFRRMRTCCNYFIALIILYAIARNFPGIGGGMTDHTSLVSAAHLCDLQGLFSEIDEQVVQSESHWIAITVII